MPVPGGQKHRHGRASYARKEDEPSSQSQVMNVNTFMAQADNAGGKEEHEKPRPHGVPTSYDAKYHICVTKVEVGLF